MNPIVQDFIILKNKLGEAITPVYLFSIQYEKESNSWLRYVRGPSNIVFAGIEYIKQGIKCGNIKEGTTGVLSNMAIQIQNADGVIQHYLQNYNGLKDCKLLLTAIFLEALDNPECFLEYEYYIDSSSLDKSSQSITLNLSCEIDALNRYIPRRIYSPTRCQVYAFKCEECGYAGPDASCGRLLSSCKEKGNRTRFGGFPGVKRALGVIT